MLISPSATPYSRMAPEMIASIPLDDASGAWDGPLKPSTEWRFHHKLMRGREDAGAVVHAHPTYCTTLAIARKPIPACHYMIAAFGGVDVRCAGYATYGTEELSVLALEAMEDRSACLLANHGMIAIGETLEKAMWRAVELETIAKQYYYSLLIGGPTVLSATDIDDTMKGFGSYGVQDDAGKATRAAKAKPKATTKASTRTAAKTTSKPAAKPRSRSTTGTRTTTRSRAK
jgi:L-fuculose-phosphate aldolase